MPTACGCSSVDRVSASEAEGRGFDPRQPRQAISKRVERAMGIEPTLSAWEAEVLPLNYARMDDILAAKLHSARQPLRRVARRKQSSLGERR